MNLKKFLKQVLSGFVAQPVTYTTYAKHNW